jgi:predicted RNase H-like nuclease (RuvC/YqgF family)
MELQRATQWIEHDRPAYWATATRKAFEQVAATRTALNACLTRTVAGPRSSCIEEKEAHDAAKRRLQHCQEQVERTKRWNVKLRQEIDEFRSRISALRRRLDGELPKTAAYLDRMIEALEQYAGMMNEAAPQRGEDEN